MSPHRRYQDVSSPILNEVEGGVVGWQIHFSHRPSGVHPSMHDRHIERDDRTSRLEDALVVDGVVATG